MTSRYQQLRQIVARLAAPAEEQVRYLDRISESMPRVGSPQDQPNDELALELEDIFLAANDMIAHAELTESEKDAVRQLGALLRTWSGAGNGGFWRCRALFEDPRWEEVRACAARSLALLPDEERAFGRFYGTSPSDPPA
jgi:hypothetical protein